MIELDVALKVLIKKSGLPLKSVSDGAVVGPSRILRWYIKPNVCLLAGEKRRILNWLRLNEQDVLSSTYDTEKVRMIALEQDDLVPLGYSSNAGSRLRSSAHIIDFLNLYYGRLFTDRILIAMGLHPKFFQNLDNTINLCFLHDLLLALKSLGFRDDQIRGLGTLMSVYHRESAIGAAYNSIKRVADVYARTIEVAPKFDVNFGYNIEVGRSSIKVFVTPTDLGGPVVYEQSSKEALRLMHLYRLGMLSNLVGFIGLGSLEIESRSAFCDGAREETFLLSTENVPNEHLQLVRPRPEVVLQ